jgi:predicted esterase
MMHGATVEGKHLGGTARRAPPCGLRCPRAGDSLPCSARGRDVAVHARPTHLRRMRTTISAVAILVALLSPGAARAQVDLREQLALSYLRLELALADAAPLPAPERARLNREFDRTTLLFFAGNMTAALGVIDSLVASLPGTPVLEELSGSALDMRARSQLAVLDEERRSARIGERSLAFMMAVPGDVARRPTTGWPVVVAVHGAGGDERMFFGGYGAGRIRTLADSLGVAVVTPAAPITPADIFALIDTLAPQHALDAGRIALLGHSMGAGIVAAAASQQPGRTRAVACIAGSCAAAAGAGESVPVIIVAGAMDPLFNVTMLERQAEAMRTGARAVEFRRMEDEGHTLVVGESLREAMRWLSDRLR